jgi:acetylglutamate kinase
VDFGHVGDIIEINDRLPRVLLDNGYLPVISSLGADAEGSVFNINADTVAAELSVRLGAEKLILMSDVDGVYLRPGDAESKISSATADEVRALIAEGVATGGMIPKLQSIAGLVARGVGSAHVISGSTRNALLSEVFTDEGTGTMIVA